METVKYPKLRDLLLSVVGSRSQQWVADLCGVSQATVSKWLTGINRPQRAHLAILVSLFKLDPRELAEAADYEPDEILRLYEAHFLGERSYLDLMDWANEKVDLIEKLWTRGDPGLAIDQAIIANRQLREALRQYSSPKHRHSLLRVLSKLLWQTRSAYYHSYLPYQGLEYLQRVAKEQLSIAEELGEDETVGCAYYSQGDTFYGLKKSKKFDKSRWYYKTASEILKDARSRAYALRGVALSSLHLEDQKGFERAQNRIRRLVDKGQFSALTVCELMESQARGQASFNQPRALNTLEESWKILAEAEAQGEKVIFYQLLLIRSELIATLHLERGNKRLIEEIGKTGVFLAQQNGYFRYAGEIEELLQQVLD